WCASDIPHLQQLLLHRVSDQVWSQSSGPAGQIISGDGEWSLGGVQRLLQTRLQRQQGLGVGQQLLHVPLQLGLPVVDLLQPLPQQTRPPGLALPGGRLRVLVQGSGLSLDAAGLVVVGTGLFEYASVVGEPFAGARGRLRELRPRRSVTELMITQFSPNRLQTCKPEENRI
uniref:Uncharacterized protein n=1 Tax=Stegastes partitus TaxID=144197 RepID=A0A3B4ZLZ6_9TELE